MFVWSHDKYATLTSSQIIPPFPVLFLFFCFSLAWPLAETNSPHSTHSGRSIGCLGNLCRQTQPGRACAITGCRGRLGLGGLGAAAGAHVPYFSYCSISRRMSASAAMAAICRWSGGGSHAWSRGGGRSLPWERTTCGKCANHKKFLFPLIFLDCTCSPQHAT